VKLEILTTDGYGLEARVRVDGTMLVVMDDFTCLPPESIDSECPEFGHLTTHEGSLSWEAMFSGNPNQEQKLQQLQGWTYDGFGVIKSIKPVVVDFGILQLAFDDITCDERCVGEWVKMRIDRLDLTFRTHSNEPDAT
jgi:hypothetical protein